MSRCGERIRRGYGIVGRQLRFSGALEALEFGLLVGGETGWGGLGLEEGAGGSERVWHGEAHAHAYARARMRVGAY